MSSGALILTGRARTGVPPSRAVAVPAQAVDAVAPAGGQWVLGRKLELSEFPPVQRVGVWLLCRVLKVPCAIPTLRATFTTRAQARERCTDRRDYLMWLPHDAPLGAQLEARRFYCEPLNDPATDARHAGMFAFEESKPEAVAGDASVTARELVRVLEDAAGRVT